MAFDPESNEFLRYYYGDAECEVFGKTYQQFVTAVLVELVYSGFVADLNDLAAMFSYRHLAQLREWVDGGDDGEDPDISRQRLVEAIDD